MKAICTSEPISWLQLERYRLGELSPSDSVAIEQHLALCPACQSCYAQSETAKVLPVLPAPSNQPSATRAKEDKHASTGFPLQWIRGWRAAALAFSTATALFLLWVIDVSTSLDEQAFPPTSLNVKGGSISLKLARQRTNTLSDREIGYVSGDRFKLLLTSPPMSGESIFVVVYQGQKADFPMTLPAESWHGNLVPLPGSLILTGDIPAWICVALGDAETVTEKRLARGPEFLPESAVCVRAIPE